MGFDIFISNVRQLRLMEHNLHELKFILRLVLVKMAVLWMRRQLMWL